MQAVKEKMQDMSAMRKAKADAKAEEKAEKELAKSRVEIAHEVRLAKEAEANMELHVSKAGKKAEREIAKHSTQNYPNINAAGAINDMGNTGPTATATGYPTDTAGAPNPMITNTVRAATTNTYGATPPTNQWL